MATIPIEPAPIYPASFPGQLLPEKSQNQKAQEADIAGMSAI